MLLASEVSLLVLSVVVIVAVSIYLVNKLNHTQKN
jgi:hypothetical protein